MRPGYGFENIAWRNQITCLLSDGSGRLLSSAMIASLYFPSVNSDSFRPFHEMIPRNGEVLPARVFVPKGEEGTAIIKCCNGRPRGQVSVSKALSIIRTSKESGPMTEIRLSGN